MNLRYLLVDSFTQTPGTGNRVVVFLDPVNLSPAAISGILESLGVGEAACLVSQDQDSFTVRFFTTTQEIAYTGHATIALALSLAREGILPEGTQELQLQTPAGPVLARIQYENGAPVRAAVRQPDPQFRDVPSWKITSEFCEALGANERYLHRGLPTGIAFSGLWSLFIPLVAPGLVDELEPDFKALAALSQKIGVDSVHAYASLGPRSFYARSFAPGIGVQEDAVSGAANAALGALLARAGVVPRREGEATLEILQGHHLGVPGVVQVQVLYSADGQPYEVWIAGQAVSVGGGSVGIA